MTDDTTVVVELPMTMRISVTFPDGLPGNPQADAAALADWAARKLSHVSHAQIDACNELNRLFPHGRGVVATVDAQVQATPTVSVLAA
ncbi:conserved protein of unknown function [Rhodovastum atsumiense]|uniref:Uncharacterized protein n=1 Tax=Rhodovastum atsumiense TaxID=504468 RepID=A0A5M6ISC8_9PROT|nr:hypothetical protein [Rhodovastum atsumiense]KAA5611132.1 hypothetical protein F1189_16190 [Rhodovastum atsumiense]CAH2599199.1 conserved protein of unknown function [Rhodovastum atsumiense]